MQRRTRIVALTMGLSLGLAAIASAEEEYGRPGAYVGVGALWAEPDVDRLDGADGTAGVDARAGYRLHRLVAVEGQVQYFDEVSGDVDTPFGTADVDLTGVAFSSNGKVYPLSGRVQPYGLVGFGASYFSGDAALEGLTVSGSAVDFNVRGGGGVDVYLSPHVVLNAEATYLRIDDSGLVPLALGAQYRF
jgi:Outer membrane protein beta-barrel domain